MPNSAPGIASDHTVVTTESQFGERIESDRMSIRREGNSRDTPSTAGAEPLGVKAKRACTMLDCGRTRLYELLNSGQLVGYKDGVSRKITVASIHAYVARLIEASRQENPRGRGQRAKAQTLYMANLARDRSATSQAGAGAHVRRMTREVAAK
jgi:hypothetical protein